ncbi:PDZ domain-containing protein [Salinispira pacifica]|uniref:PDZ domain-containing protein n=1 Tax=Salinispira pacifica TaxID=1307761 RepID=UPI000411B64A|nr:PDZ domain-containing protein [Salinispira pacifica]
MGFSIPINNVKKAVDDFIEQGMVEYGWLGVSIISIDESIAEGLNLDNTDGALINSVYQNSPAGRSALRPGDFITGINGLEIDSSDALVREVGDLIAGETAEFQLIRNGSEINVEVEITSRDTEEEIAGQSRDLFPGFSVYPLTDEIQEQIEGASDLQGVIVSQVIPRTPSAIAGLSAGDIVTAVNGADISDLVEFYEALGQSDDETEISYWREGVELKVTIVK